jgi:hypothetical protein
MESVRRSGFGWRRGCGCGCGSGFATQDLKHYRPTGGALSFDCFAPVFHCFLHAINYLFLGFALDAISFGHKNIATRRFMRRSSYGYSLGGGGEERQLINGDGNAGESIKHQDSSIKELSNSM